MLQNPFSATFGVTLSCIQMAPGTNMEITPKILVVEDNRELRKTAKR